MLRSRIRRSAPVCNVRALQFCRHLRVHDEGAGEVDASDDDVHGSSDHYVENAWSLYGAADAALKLGRRAMSDDYRARADRAWKDADVPFASPCPQLFG